MLISTNNTSLNRLMKKKGKNNDEGKMLEGDREEMGSKKSKKKSGQEHSFQPQTQYKRGQKVRQREHLMYLQVILDLNFIQFCSLV